MIDLHALSSGGSTGAYGAIGTILLGGDGQATAGVPIRSDATLIGWGELSTVADTIFGAKLATPDQDDQNNNETFQPGAASLIGMFNKWTQIPYTKGARAFTIRQNTGAANAMAYMMDWYEGKAGECVSGSYFPGKPVVYPQTSGAITAITWQPIAYAPGTALPNGKYAILGAWVNALTNYGLIRFQHNSFQGFKPGFPVLDSINVTAAAGLQVTNKDPFLLHNGYQFVYLSEKTRKPCCPVFEVTAAGSGLTIETTAITADTPIINPHIVRIA